MAELEVSDIGVTSLNGLCRMFGNGLDVRNLHHGGSPTAMDVETIDPRDAMDVETVDPIFANRNMTESLTPVLGPDCPDCRLLGLSGRQRPVGLTRPPRLSGDDPQSQSQS